jgi:hypothetical protein
LHNAGMDNKTPPLGSGASRLTMLDYFAAAALQGMLHGLLSRKGSYVAEKDWVQQGSGLNWPHVSRAAEVLPDGTVDWGSDYPTQMGSYGITTTAGDRRAVYPEDCAADAYRIAKAMLKEREKHGSEE